MMEKYSYLQDFLRKIANISFKDNYFLNIKHFDLKVSND